jgi:hypothetical protein
VSGGVDDEIMSGEVLQYRVMHGLLLGFMGSVNRCAEPNRSQIDFGPWIHSKYTICQTLNLVAA